MEAGDVLTSANDRPGWKRSFLRHYLEMVVVMLASMAALGMIVSLIFKLLGHANLYHYADLRAFIMATNMTVGMIVWMRLRGHGWTSAAEMAGAMFLPVVLLIGPYEAGLISGGVLLGGMHLLMLPFMAIAMLRRREEYSGSHGKHSTRGHTPAHA